MVRPSRILLAAFAAPLLTGAMPARSAEAQGFTPEQRREIVEIVREALKTDPTILTEAVAALRESEQKQAEAGALKVLETRKAELQGGPAYTVRGNPAGDVTVVEFLDPRCGYCRAMAPLVDRLLASDGKVRLVEKVIPVLGANSVLDAQAILAAARQGGYEKMKRALMTDREAPTADRIRAIARSNGLDADRLIADLHDPSVAKEIDGNLAQARAIGLDGTPTFLFGTVSIVPGALSEAELKERVKQARAKSS
jgi:protein-disulfide isomerase